MMSKEKREEVGQIFYVSTLRRIPFLLEIVVNEENHDSALYFNIFVQGNYFFGVRDLGVIPFAESAAVAAAAAAFLAEGDLERCFVGVSARFLAGVPLPRA